VNLGDLPNNVTDIKSAVSAMKAKLESVADGAAVVWFMLPSSADGHLDIVRQIVLQDFDGMRQGRQRQRSLGIRLTPDVTGPARRRTWRSPAAALRPPTCRPSTRRAST
jgi:hypothetical protein